MKLYRATWEESQADADNAFGYLNQNDDAFAASVALGQTVAWDTPKQGDRGWFIHIEPKLYALFNVVLEEEV